MNEELELATDRIRYAYKAREAESNRDWSEAARLWRASGNLVDEAACLLIYQSIQYGDKFRSLVKEKLIDVGLPEDCGACSCPQFDAILREAHKEVYHE